MKTRTLSFVSFSTVALRWSGTGSLVGENNDTLLVFTGFITLQKCLGLVFKMFGRVNLKNEDLVDFSARGYAKKSVLYVVKWANLSAYFTILKHLFSC